MRRFRLLAAWLVLFPALPGCDQRDSSSSGGSSGGAGGLKASPPPAYEPPSTWRYSAAPGGAPDGGLSDAVGAVAPSGKDAGRALFDGDSRRPSDAGGGSPVVSGNGGPAPGGPKASFTAGSRKDTLTIAEPPAPGDPAKASSGNGGGTAVPKKGGAKTPGGGTGDGGALDGGAAAPPVAALGSGGACPDGMVGFPGFCVDRYEFPNRAGAMPLAAQTAIEGEEQCKAAGKRLCAESEWETACRGGTSRALPYDGGYEKGRCNDDKTWILVTDDDWKKFNSGKEAGQAHAKKFYQADASGSRARCVTPEGVFDLLGNSAEWTVAAPGRKHGHVMKGGFWSGAWNGGGKWGCSLTNTGHPGRFRSYEAGFRCCLSRPS